MPALVAFDLIKVKQAPQTIFGVSWISVIRGWTAKQNRERSAAERPGPH